MMERRALPRQRVIKGAKIAYGNFMFLQDCSVYDLTKVGARLRLPKPAPLPDAFHVFFSDSHTICPVRVIWRKGRDVGVAFEDEPKSVHDLTDPRLKRFAYM